MVIVVDASLAVKWYLDEGGSDAAAEVLSQYSGDIIVPDIMMVEVTSALVRNANMVKSSRQNVVMALERFSALFADGDIVARRSGIEDIVRGASLAITLGHPLKDCIYLTLAMDLGCDLITCDARFAAKAREVWAGVRVLGALT